MVLSRIKLPGTFHKQHHKKMIITIIIMTIIKIILIMIIITIMMIITKRTMTSILWPCNWVNIGCLLDLEESVALSIKQEGGDCQGCNILVATGGWRAGEGVWRAGGGV